ncbi:peptidase S41 [Flavobacterium sp. Sd200]|uniref:S41 family peptidase n=1 Tax=Flavobacterium sp. Sd200 TaxID=2692211 RepID=UPI00136D4003|nr:S41 family peptidase [Flavobacterium sp. Sd200]MXN90270.1 peptidase S41 [Flavobacterium sp. Sd200]
MKKLSLLVFSLIAGALTLQSCEDLDDNAVPVSDFVWKGLNAYYLWQADVPELADDRFANQEQLNRFLEAYNTPEQLFQSLLYRPDEIDRFSVIFPDFTVLESLLQGVSKSNGMEFGLRYTSASGSSIFGYVRYIMPNSDAASKDIARGDIFYGVNGTPLTDLNYSSLLSADTYTLNMASYTDGVLVPNGREVTLTRAQYAENPVHTVTTVTRGSHNIGYLLYNGFYSNYDNQLNAAFDQLKTAGVTDLVLDLRYNGGGSVRTATYLASMITGQFNGQLFAKEQWNAKLQAIYENQNPGALQNLFTNQISNSAAINSLNLNKVYILTTVSTASASELIINCLKPYIDVVQIGDTTTGKNVGSVTLYDSRDFSANGRNGSHRYAMQPIVIKVVNKDNFGEYSEGISPDASNLLEEDYSNLGVLGDPAEPLFARAVALITGTGRQAAPIQGIHHKPFRDSKNMRRFGNEMYIENMPEGYMNIVKDLR